MWWMLIDVRFVFDHTYGTIVFLLWLACNQNDIILLIYGQLCLERMCLYSWLVLHLSGLLSRNWIHLSRTGWYTVYDELYTRRNILPKLKSETAIHQWKLYLGFNMEVEPKGLAFPSCHWNTCDSIGWYRILCMPKIMRTLNYKYNS